MTNKNWLVVGISGVTCGGKTSLVKALKDKFPESILIAQDDYFWPPDAPAQVIVPEFNHPNYELMTSLDMPRMREDVKAALSCPPTSKESPVLLLDGFSLFRDSWLADLCDLKFFITLNKEECWRRRRIRVYDPPDPTGYFEKVVWPEYERISSEALALNGVIEIDGALPKKETAKNVIAKIQSELNLRFECLGKKR